MKRTVLSMLIFVFTATGSYGQLWKLYEDSARVLRAERKLAAAAGYYIKAISLLKKDSLGTYSHGLTCMSLGILYINTAQFPQADTILSEAKNILKKLKQDGEVANVCDNMGNMYRNISRYDKAEAAYREAMQLREGVFGKSDPMYGVSCDNLGILYQITGRYKESESLLMEARRIFEKKPGKQHRYFAVNAGNLAILFSTLGKMDRAEELMLEANEVWPLVSGKESLDYALSCNNLGNMYSQTAQYDKAEPLFLAAQKIRGDILGKQHPGYALVCNNLGNLYEEMGQYAKSEKFLLEARQVYEKNKSHMSYASNCENLGILYRSMGLPEKSLSYALETQEVRKSVLGSAHPWSINSGVNIGLAYSELKKYDLAEKTLLEVKKAYEDKIGKDYPGYAHVCNTLAGVYRLTRQYEKAGELGLQARIFGEKEFRKEHPAYAMILTNLALIYRGQGKDEQAATFFNEIFEARKAQTEKIFSFSSEYEKQSFLQSVFEEWKYYYTFCYDRLPPDKSGQPFNLSLYYRNRILSSIQQLNRVINNSADPEIQNKYGEWKTLKQQLAFWLIKPETEQADEKILLQEKANLVEKELTRLSGDFRKQSEKNNLDWKTVQSQLKPGEAAIEFIDFEYDTGEESRDSSFYIALVLNKNMMEPAMVKLFEKKELQKLLATKSNAGKTGINLLYSSPELYMRIWQPLEKHLKGISKIYFTPSGLLHYVSMAAIKVNKGQTLSDKFQLVQLLSTGAVTEQAEHLISASDDFILYGAVQYNADSASLKQAAIVYGGNHYASRSIPEELLGDEEKWVFKPLPKTETEISFIEKMARLRKNPVRIFRGVNANEESFKSLDGKSSPGVLHIATHAFFYPDPAKNKRYSREAWGRAFKLSDNPLFRAGLVMSGAENTWRGKAVAGVEDGILTAYEVSNMYLPNTRLAVLSACQTGLGDIQGTEGVYGLQRAFKLAGVQNLVMSLWDVDDAAGAEFMEEFYKNLFADKTIADAFGMAQDFMKKRYRNNPYLWAGFILIR